VRPAYYAIAEDDRTIDLDLQRSMAARMHAEVISLGAGHLSLIPHAPEVADLIRRAARIRA
jgi:pimeloyl-ACP methyl ester carboxylesterase